MDNGAFAWAVALSLPLAFDAYLVRTGHTSLTCHVRHHPWITCLGASYLAAHFAGRPRSLRRFDPLGCAARRLAR